MADKTTGNQLDDLISKSLDAVDEIVKGLQGSTEELAKAQDDEDLNAGDVSEDAPEDTADDDEADADREDAEADREDADADRDDADAGEPDDGAEEQDDNEGAEEDTEKSLEDELTSNDSVRKALEVSEFLQELVKGINAVVSRQGDTISAHGEALSKSLQANEGAINVVVKSFQGLATTQKTVIETQAEILKSIRKLNKRLGNIEAQPVARKSVSTAPAQVIEKSFAGSTPSDTLSKSQVLAKLNAELDKGNLSVGQDILAYEGTGMIGAISAQTRALIGL